MTARAPWFCPSCQKHHGPHVDTCPGGGVGMQPPIVTVPFIQPVPPSYQQTPWVPYEQTTCTSAVRPDPNVMTFGSAYSIATGLQ